MYIYTYIHTYIHTHIYIHLLPKVDHHTFGTSQVCPLYLLDLRTLWTHIYYSSIACAFTRIHLYLHLLPKVDHFWLRLKVCPLYLLDLSNCGFSLSIYIYLSIYLSIYLYIYIYIYIYICVYIYIFIYIYIYLYIYIYIPAPKSRPLLAMSQSVPPLLVEFEKIVDTYLLFSYEHK